MLKLNLGQCNSVFLVITSNFGDWVFTTDEKAKSFVENYYQNQNLMNKCSNMMSLDDINTEITIIEYQLNKNSVFKDSSYKILWKSDHSLVKCNRELKKVYFIATEVDGDTVYLEAFENQSDADNKINTDYKDRVRDLRVVEFEVNVK